MLSDRFLRLVRILDRVTPGASRSLSWEVFLAALSFPASILLNRALGAEDRGLLALVVLVPTTLFALASCQWDRLLKGLITSQQISAREAWRRTVYYACWLSVTFIPIGVISSAIYAKVPLEMRVLSVLYCASFPIYFLALCLSATFVASGSVNGQYWMKTSLNFSYLTLLLLLFGSGQISVSSIVFVYIAIHAIALVVGWANKAKILGGTVLASQPPLRILARSFLPYVLEVFSGRLDIWAFSMFGTLVVLGHYVGITALMTPVSFVSNALNSGSTARLDWTRADVVRRYLLRTALTLLVVLAGLAVGGVLVGPILLNGLLGKSFLGSEWMIPWVALIVVSGAIAAQFHSALQLSGLGRAYLAVQTAEPVIRLPLVLGFGWWLSEFGILLGMSIASLLKTAVCFWLHHRRPPELILLSGQ